MNASDVCKHLETDVRDSRPEDYMGYVSRRRRHKCRACGERWTTYELSADDLEELTADTKSYMKKNERLKSMFDILHGLIHEGDQS